MRERQPIRRVLVVGSGGREHALAWRLARDPEAPQVLVAPGNDGIAARFEVAAVDALDVAGIAQLARERDVDLVVVGPEAPLAAGLADVLAADGRLVFGPSQEAAQLESSKWFAKEIMAAAGVPTARAEHCVTRAEALAALDRFAPPWVVKADGLAAGKGVLVSADRAQVERFADDCLAGARFGAGGRSLVIEEFLAGVEATVLAICDGERFVLLPAARDYKRALDHDRGANTGGMGALAPHPGVDASVEAEVGRRVVAPVLAAMRARGTPFRGVLYCGLMLGPGGVRVIEFNARFGDPETQAVLPILDGSLSRLLASAAAGELEEGAITRTATAAVAVVLADCDYPGTPAGTGRIVGLEQLGERALTFHAGTRANGEGWRVSGGRACTIVATGADLERARHAAYDAIDTLSGEGWRCRRDIAARGDAGSSAQPWTAPAGAGLVA